jgi:hypothetical protein
MAAVCIETCGIRTILQARTVLAVLSRCGGASLIYPFAAGILTPQRPPRATYSSHSAQRPVRLTRGEMTLDVENIELQTAACAERNFWAEPGLLNRCILRSRRRVG